MSDQYPSQDWRGSLQDMMVTWRGKLAKLLLIPQLSTKEAHDLRHRIIDNATLDQGYTLMCALSAGIAILGLLQSSTAVVIGAMLVSPLMGPIAALGVAFASIDGERIRGAARTVAVGAGIGISTGMLLTWISPISDATPEILARTQPNLLDLAVALLSGLAGGYATMMGKGETAIGVAIATALMPPLATVGYGLGTLNAGYAMGAMLLFLTNLSAIAFAFALVARLSGAARPARHLVWSPRYSLVLIGVFLILAIPLAVTMVQVKRELNLRSAARMAIRGAYAGGSVNIAQLDVKWPIFGKPEVRAVTIAPSYIADLDQRLGVKLDTYVGKDATLVVQQVLATDTASQAKALASAAMERSLSEFVAEGPPVDLVRRKLGLPVRGMWDDRARKILFVEPVAAPGWTLADYRAGEAAFAANNDLGSWAVKLVPPVENSLTITLDDTNRAGQGSTPDLAAWALSRWGLEQVGVEARDGSDLNALRDALKNVGITMVPTGSQTMAAGIAVATVVPKPAKDPQ